jgi:hypothetical protein
MRQHQQVLCIAQPAIEMPLLVQQAIFIQATPQQAAAIHAVVA